MPIPETIYECVDRSDQLIKYYNVLRQTKKYWKTLFFNFIDVAVVNAYVLHKEYSSNPISHYEFWEQLVRRLCCLSSPNVTLPARHSTSVNIDHRLVRMDSICVYCSIVCKQKHRTTRQCAKCKAPLCFQSRDYSSRWHDRAFSKSRDEWLANLFMDRFERAFLAREPIQPLVWKRYIDDILCIWTGSRSELDNFLDRLNRAHHSMKFTWNISNERMQFLDLNIFKGDRFTETGLLDLSTHFKSTNTFQYI